MVKKTVTTVTTTTTTVVGGKQYDYILIDRSGSMSGMWSDALGSVNTYVAKLAEDHVDTKITVALFDLNGPGLDFSVIRRNASPRDWKKISNADGVPRGGTPLNDATGRLVAMAEEDGGDNVSIIIMTDGQENASREYNVHQIKAKLDACRAKGWVITFLGANFDNASQATGYGAMAANAVQSSVANMAGTMRMTASKRAFYGATGQAATMDFSDDEKEQLKK